MRTLSLLLFAAFSFPAAALECGQLVDRDVVLTHDLDCTGPGPALRVVRSGVRIALAGHRIRTAAHASAIEVSDVHGVSIRGPGRIEGAMSGVEALRTRGLRVEGVHFASVGEGVRLTNARQAEIRDNRFERVAGHAVVALALPGAFARSGGHRISGNGVQGAEYGVLVGAPAAPGSLIDDNEFDAIGTFGVMVSPNDVVGTDNRFGAVGVAPLVD